VVQVKDVYFPTIIGWELTLSCNLECIHCASSAGKERPKELTLNESLSIADQFPALLVQEVNFTGGEPLLRADWFWIADHLRELEIRSKILTNGLNLNAESISNIKKSGIECVGISLDGLEQTHDYIRGYSGLFQRIIRGVKQLEINDIPVAIITTVNPFNIQELPNLFKLILSLGVDRWQIQPICSLGRASNFAGLRLTIEQYLQLGIFIKRIKPTAEELGLEIPVADNLGYFSELDIAKSQWRGCPAGLLSCGITSDGKVKGCLSFPNEIIEGDLRKSDLWDIWFDPNSFSYNRSFSSEMLGPECNQCDKSNQCRGGCSAMSYGSTKKFHNDPYCFYKMTAKIENR
jgi:radical SAM protein with 4Fe4S-binding SPASM domain